MKYLITTLNSKYVHTSLSVRCIFSSVKDRFDCDMKEYTINDNLNYICADIYKIGADVICFSCYIWNYSLILTLCENLKKARPDIKIVLGGPEVSYTACEVLANHPFVDFVVCGEGEVSTPELFDCIENNSAPLNVKGIAFMQGDEVAVNTPRDVLSNLDDLPFVYDETIDEYKNKIIYYETSRGCPFSCTYCLSGEKGGVRFLSMERVRADIDFFVSHKVSLVKLVDRTFNANPCRARDIIEYIMSVSKETRFHMELAGDLLDDDTISLLKQADKNIFQFEIGVQTTNPVTMEAINRKISWEPLKGNIIRLLNETNIHIHLDLIAGLPYEDIKSFSKSFNDVLDLKPHVLQLGFLKLLKGSAIRQCEDDFNYKYTTNSPYEIICNDFVSYSDILHLHNIDSVFDRYYNSASFIKTLDKLFDAYSNDYFLLFSDIANFFEDNGYFGIAVSKYVLYDILHEFAMDKGINCIDELKYDYIKNIKSHNMPKWCKTQYTREFTDCCYMVLKDEEFKKRYFPHYFDVPAKEVFKYVKFETFSDRVLLFDFKTDTETDVSQYFCECNLF